MNKDHFKRADCRLCKSKTLTQVLQLAPTPPANALVKKEQTNARQQKYPLDVYFCESCAHVQLLDVVDPEILFRDYVYVSGTSPVFVKHFQEYANTLIKSLKLKGNDHVVEIGSNDGTLLKFFKDAGMSVLGIDPALKIAQEATDSGIETLPEFFNTALAEKISSEHGKAHAVVANNVFAHIDDLDEILRGVKTLLHPSGAFVFEVSYLLDVIEKTLFDTIYHEHLDYHSVKPLKAFFAMNGMNLFKVERVSSHGGSLRGYAQLNSGSHATDASVEAFIAEEARRGLHAAKTFLSFGDQINQVGNELKAILTKFKKAGKKVAGYGSPAKATTLMHHFGLDSELIEFIVDDSPWKQGLYSPGLYVPIKSSKAIIEEKPDVLVVMAWNFADSIIEKNKSFMQDGGAFVVPLPNPKVVTL